MYPIVQLLLCSRNVSYCTTITLLVEDINQKKHLIFVGDEEAIHHQHIRLYWDGEQLILFFLKLFCTLYCTKTIYIKRHSVGGCGKICKSQRLARPNDLTEVSCTYCAAEGAYVPSLQFFLSF